MTLSEANAKGWKKVEVLESGPAHARTCRVTLAKKGQDIRGHGNTEKEALKDALEKLKVHLKS